MAELVYTPRAQFMGFHNRPQRWATVVTHRRAGKTVALANDIILGARSCVLSRPQFAYIGPTFTQAKRISWQYLKDYSEKWWLKPPSESELKLTIAGIDGQPATIYCLGADNPDSLRGMYLDGAVMDEYAMFRPSVFTQIIRPALSDRGGWGVFASTPRGRNLFYDLYKLGQRDPANYHLTYLSADVSGIIPASELEDLRKHMDPEEFAQEYLCSFDSALKGAIYANEVNTLFADGRAYNVEGDPEHALYDPSLPTHFVFDLGYTDSTVRIAWQNTPAGGINVVNVESTNGADVFYHIESLRNFADATIGTTGGIGDVWLPHDSRAKNFQTGKSVLEQFLEHGFYPRIVPNHNVRDGISAARRVFPAVTIDMTPQKDSPDQSPVTGELLEALKAYRREWDEDHMCFSERPLHDWASDYADAFRYLAVAALPGLRSDRTSDRKLEELRTNASLSSIDMPDYNLEQLHADRMAQSSWAYPRMA